MPFLIVALIISIIVNICLGLSLKNDFKTILERNEEIRKLKKENDTLRDEVRKYKIPYENIKNNQINSKIWEDKYYDLSEKYIRLKSENDKMQKQNIHFMNEYSRPRLIPKYLIIPNTDLYNQVFQEERGEKAQSGKIHLVGLKGQMYSEYSKKTYTTSFTECDCEDFTFQHRKNPDHICKHMIAFALEMKKLENEISHPFKNIDSLK